MNRNELDLTPEQARDQLTGADDVTLTSDRDRRVHARATAAFGVTVGVYVALSRLADNSQPWQGLAIAGYVVALGLLAWWQSRAPRTVPRHSRRISWLGLGGTIGLMLAAIVTLNILSVEAERDGRTDPSTEPWVLALTAIVVALPMVVAAVRIRKP